MPIAVFLSTVSDEFRAYRDQLRGDLTRHNVAVKVQEDFKDLGGDTLDKLDVYIAHCDAVVHLVGDMCGYIADETQQRALLAKHADLQSKLPPLGEALAGGTFIPYTQWEAWLALYHGKSLLIAKAKATAPRAPEYAPNDASRAAQIEHVERLKAFHRYPGSEFGSPDELAKQIAYTAILDLLVKDYAEKAAQEREVAEGFIREMAKRVAGDAALDLDGMKQAVRNAIEIYEKEIAGRPAETNLDEIVGRALARAKEQVDCGQSNLARATLRRAAQEMQREEEDRRERYVAGVTALYHRERDIALASYDGDAAADATIELARSIRSANAGKIAEFVGSEAQALYEYGRDRGSNVHLVAAVRLCRSLLALANSIDERGAAQNKLGVALKVLGERESGSTRLDEAVEAYRAALKEKTRDRAPREWALTKSNLGVALVRLGERESDTVRLEEAVVVYREALTELVREQVPLQWAAVQSNLGNALVKLGERDGGMERLEEAVAAYGGALEEYTRERIPLRWAATQNNLGNALKALGEREGGTGQLEEAVAAYRVALVVRTRERVPLDWAATQNNLGNALKTLGERESGTARLGEAVEAYHAALEEYTRELVPLHWANSFGGHGVAMMLMADRTNNGMLAEAAVQQIEAAYETLRDGSQQQWAANLKAQLPKAQTIRDRLKGK